MFILNKLPEWLWYWGRRSTLRNAEVDGLVKVSSLTNFNSGMGKPLAVVVFVQSVLDSYLSTLELSLYWVSRVRLVWVPSRTCSVAIPKENVEGQSPITACDSPKNKKWVYVHKVHKPWPKYSPVQTPKTKFFNWLSLKTKTKKQANTWTPWSPNFFLPQSF